MHHGGERGGGLDVTHDGDVGDVGIITDEGALGTSERLILNVTRLEALAAESVATANQQTRLLFAVGRVGHLTHRALEHDLPLSGVSLLI